MSEIRVLVRRKPDRPRLQLFYVCPLTGRDVTRSARTNDWGEAERAAGAWEEELRTRAAVADVSWDGFRERFDDEYLADMPEPTRRQYHAALDHFERLMGHPRRMDRIATQHISKFKARLSSELATATVAKVLRHLKAALNWAADMGFIRDVPRFIMPSLAQRKLARSRPITAAEFRQMMKAVRLLVKKQAERRQWRRLLRGLYLSGLRLGEALRLDWDRAPVRLDLDSGRFPRIVWYGDGQKSGKDEVVPITPDFAALLRRTSAELRTGRVFKLARMSDLVHISKFIAAIGRAAGVIVNDTGKHASAHDLRRSFGSCWAPKVKPLVLKTLMRHATIGTTLAYYVEIDSDEIAEALWADSVPHRVQKKAGGSNAVRRRKHGKHSNSAR